MLNWLKNKKQHLLDVEVKESVINTIHNPNNYPKEVLEIHHEFSIAAERLLIEAKSAIDKAATKDVEKVERLEKLGFKQANQVSELKPIIKKAEVSKEQIELLKYYQFNYPNNKFITEEQVKAICYKWNLVCGDVDRYKGFVPEKNLVEIEKFSLKDTDKNIMPVYDRNDNIVGYVAPSDFTEEYNYNYCKTHGSMYVSFKGNAIVNVRGGEEKFGEFARVRNEISKLKICAPIKDMDMTGMTIEDGYNIKKIHIPDPVVLQPVKGGYLIITAWGDEASDENVVNQKMN